MTEFDYEIDLSGLEEMEAKLNYENKEEILLTEEELKKYGKIKEKNMNGGGKKNNKYFYKYLKYYNKYNNLIRDIN